MPTDQLERVDRAIRRIGRFEIRTVSDGILKTGLDVLVGLDQAEKERLTGVKGSDPIFLPVNCFQLEIDGKPALIDAGAGTTMGPTLGKLPANLQALGIAPESIRTILLTHIHPDHSNGLVDAQGRAVYPNAEVIVHEREAAFWLDRETKPDDPERLRRATEAARFSTGPYRDRMRRVSDGEVFPGISVRLNAGHTPGHSGWLFASESERLLIWGDIVHLASVQVPRPDTVLVFDVDQAMARQSRLEVFDWVADERIRVGGAHLEYPGYGYMERTADGYAYRPEL
jgi:glyoxylase-like metal-dependent hydrolase (beta-lactamase superfamily II)